MLYISKVATEAVKAGADEGLRAWYTNKSVRLSVEPERINKMIIIMKAHYPPNTYNARNKTMRRKFAANNKRVHILETAKDNEDVIKMCIDQGLVASKITNRILMEKLGQ